MALSCSVRDEHRKLCPEHMCHPRRISYLAWQVTVFRRKAKSYPSFSCPVGVFKVDAFHDG